MAVFETHSAAQTEEVAACLAESLSGGEVLLLSGGLGAGKTAFVRGLVRGLQGDANEVSSPTFALMNQYAARLPVYHFDLYRLGGPEEVLDLGFDEYFFSGEGVCAVEWSQVAGDLWKDVKVIRVLLEGEGEERRITVEGLHGTADFGRLLQHGIGVRDAR
jgi:tRNA threonylcarbamoyladenosine biosynthesis protein TsaE